MMQITYTIGKIGGGKFYTDESNKFTYADWDGRLDLVVGDLLCWTAGSDGYVQIKPREYNGKTYYGIYLCKGTVAKAGSPEPKLPDDPFSDDIVPDWLSGGANGDSGLPF